MTGFGVHNRGEQTSLSSFLWHVVSQETYKRLPQLEGLQVQRERRFITRSFNGNGGGGVIPSRYLLVFLYKMEKFSKYKLARILDVIILF